MVLERAWTGCGEIRYGCRVLVFSQEYGFGMKIGCIPEANSFDINAKDSEKANYKAVVDVSFKTMI